MCMVWSIYAPHHRSSWNCAVPVISRFQIAKPDIVAFFDSLPVPVLRESEIARILDEQREFWRLTKSTTVATFIGDLTRKSKLRAFEVPFPQGGGSGWTWGDVPTLEALQGIVPHS